LFDYALPGGLPAGSRTVWSRLPLQPLVIGPLTPFSHSVLEEIAGRAWYQYYDRLGFAPMPKARIVRQYQCRPYLNLTLSAQRDAEQAAVEPLMLRLDGQLFPVAKWEKPGLLAGIKAGFAQKKIEELLKKLTAELDAIAQKTQAWYAKTQDLRWTQAEILQVMEEIELISIPSFMVFFAVRHQLDLAYNRLIRVSMDKGRDPTLLRLIDTAISVDLNAGDAAMPAELRTALADLRTMAVVDPATVAWLQAGNYEGWQQTLPNPQLTLAVQEFLRRYGHRVLGDGEIRTPRWQEDPGPLFVNLLATREQTTNLTPPNDPMVQPLLTAVDASRRKDVEQLVQRIHQLLPLQSQALHIFAYASAGTRLWAMAAAKEAMLDQRLRTVDEVFFFALEEMKEMMTGEWNISSKSEIHATCARRKAEFDDNLHVAAPAVLVGETAAIAQ